MSNPTPQVEYTLQPNLDTKIHDHRTWTTSGARAEAIRLTGKWIKACDRLIEKRKRGSDHE